jgi:hypothetical protein
MAVPVSRVMARTNEQLNVLADHRAAAALELRAAAKPHSSSRYPPAKTIFVTAPGISPAVRTHAQNQWPTEFELTFLKTQHWSDGL